MKPTSLPRRHCLLILLSALSLPCLSMAQENAPAPDPTSPDVQESVTYDLGGQLLTVQRVTEDTIPIQLPPPVAETPAPQPYVPPTAAELAEIAHSHSYNIGGTVYHPKAGPNRSRITFSSSSDHPPVELWSSIDWNLLTPGGFTTPQGEN